MSKNIIIQEGGNGKQLTAAKLKTALVGGGNCLWVPEDETQLTTKYISENGTFTAEAEGYYGFSEVTVSGIGDCYGHDSDGDYAVAHEVDGNIVIDKLPSSIRVITPPSKEFYSDGESIDLTGIVVRAYTENGALWTDADHPNGVLPIEELSTNPTVVHYDPTYDNVIYSNDDFTVNATLYQTGANGRFTYGNIWGMENSAFMATYYDGCVYFASGDGQEHGHHSITIDAYGGSGARFSYYFDDTSFPDPYNYFARSSIDPESVRNVMEDLTPHGDGSPVTVTVSWRRPGDGLVLTDTFVVRVRGTVST